MQKVSYVLQDKDIVLFNLYKNLERVEIKRKKTILRWLVCFMLLSALLVLQLYDRTSTGIVLAMCFIWILISNSFMNRILMKQYKKESVFVKFEHMMIEAQTKQLIIRKGEKDTAYLYSEITHFLFFPKLLLLTLKSGESILIPRHAFRNKKAYRQFYIQILDLCD